LGSVSSTTRDSRSAISPAKATCAADNQKPPHRTTMSGAAAQRRRTNLAYVIFKRFPPLPLPGLLMLPH
jgi:hypothetical protein